MKRIFSAAAAAVLTAPLLVGTAVLGAPSASAAGICDQVYPAGQAYRITIAPTRINVRRGSEVVLYSNTTRAGVPCNGQVTRIWTKTSRPGSFFQPGGLSRIGSGSLGNGFTTRVGVPQRTFGWFYAFNNQGVAARSAAGIVFVR